MTREKSEFDSTDSIEGIGYEEPVAHDLTTRVVILVTVALIGGALLCGFAACILAGLGVINLFG